MVRRGISIGAALWLLVAWFVAAANLTRTEAPGRRAETGIRAPGVSALPQRPEQSRPPTSGAVDDGDPATVEAGRTQLIEYGAPLLTPRVGDGRARVEARGRGALPRGPPRSFAA